jgi:hypothetical protein
MDFLDLCQGLGLALAAGLVIGAVLPPVMPSWGVLAGAAPLAVIVCALSLDSTGEPVWPAVLIGIIGGGLAGVVSRDVVSGASRRQAQAASAPGRTAAGSGSAGVTAIVVLSAIVLAALSLFVPPVSLVAAAALAWVWLGRRRREQQKHEGLRVLR